MAEIFISYARADREKIEALAATAEAHGHAVRWDRQILGGDDFVANIERELNAARAVIVAWSRVGSTSHWVRDEAQVAANAGKLVATSLEDYRLNLKRWLYPQPELLKRLEDDLRTAGMDFL